MSAWVVNKLVSPGHWDHYPQVRAGTRSPTPVMRCRNWPHTLKMSIQPNCDAFLCHFTFFLTAIYGSVHLPSPLWRKKWVLVGQNDAAFSNYYMAESKLAAGFSEVLLSLGMSGRHPRYRQDNWHVNSECFGKFQIKSWPKGKLPIRSTVINGINTWESI